MVSSSLSPVVIDHSTPDPKTSLAKTNSVATNARRQSRPLSGSFATKAKLIRRPCSLRSATLSKSIAIASASVQQAGPNHSPNPHRRASRSTADSSIATGASESIHQGWNSRPGRPQAARALIGYRSLVLTEFSVEHREPDRLTVDGDP